MASGATEAQLRALGSVTFQFGMLDFMTRGAVIVLLGGHPQRTRAVTDELGFGSLVETIRRLLPIAGFEKQVIERWEKWCAEASSANQNRNAVTHAAWFPGSTPGELLQVRLGRRRKPEEWVRDERSLLAVADEIDRCLVNLMNVMADTPGFEYLTGNLPSQEQSK